MRLRIKSLPKGRSHGLGRLVDKRFLPESQTINLGMKTFTESAQAHCRIVQTSESDEFFIFHLSRWEHLLLMSHSCFTSIYGMCICVCGKKVTYHFSSMFPVSGLTICKNDRDGQASSINSRSLDRGSNWMEGLGCSVFLRQGAFHMCGRKIEADINFMSFS